MLKDIPAWQLINKKLRVLVSTGVQKATNMKRRNREKEKGVMLLLAHGFTWLKRGFEKKKTLIRFG